MTVENKLTAVVVNYKTPELTERAAGSLKRFYPGIPLMLIDNGSGDDSAVRLSRLKEQMPGIEIIFNETNIHHGPALNQAMHACEKHLILFLDSDCEVLKGGFLEQMVERIESSPLAFAVGKKVTINHRGFEVADPEAGHPNIRPFCMLIKRDLYFTLPPFMKHGTPGIETMKAAFQKKYGLIDFPVLDYVRHEGRGTAGKFGYALGLKGKLNHLFQKLGL